MYDPRPALKKELELFMDSILRSDRPVTDLLTADHTFINEQVALIYGYTDIRGNGFHKVTLADPNRHGLLGKGAVLMLTANPNRTAPVLRGAWIMERILGTPPAIPPPNVPDLSEAVKGKPATVREQTEIHRAQPGLRKLPRGDGPAGLRAGELRHRGRLPHDRPAVAPADRLLGHDARRHSRWPALRTCTRRWLRAATSSRRSSPRS